MPHELGPLRREDLLEASALCLRSKAHWGYNAAFLDACRSELRLRDEDIARNMICAAREGGQISGVVQIAENEGVWDLEKLFVDPPAMRRGLGRDLFRWAIGQIRVKAGAKLIIAADLERRNSTAKWGRRRLA